MTHLDVIEVNVNVVDIKSKKNTKKIAKRFKIKSQALPKVPVNLLLNKQKKQKAVNKGTEQVKENMEPRVE